MEVKVNVSKNIDKLKVANEVINTKLKKVAVIVSEKVKLKGMFGKIKLWFASKFSLIVIIKTFEGNLMFYLLKVKKGIIKIGDGYYRISDKAIKRTNLKHDCIMFNENNPSPCILEYEKSSGITSDQLEMFMKTNVLTNAIKFMKDSSSGGGLGFTHWLIILGIGVVALLVILNLFGVIDVGKFVLGG